MNKLTLALLSGAAISLAACQAPQAGDTIKPAPTVPAVKPSQTLSPVTCQDQSVSLDLSNKHVTQRGNLQGYNYCEYNIALKAGQHLDVDFDAPTTTGAEVIVFDRSDLTAVDLIQEGYTASHNEVLPVRVLLTRNEARSGKAYPFEVKFAVK